MFRTWAASRSRLVQCELRQRQPWRNPAGRVRHRVRRKLTHRRLQQDDRYRPPGRRSNNRCDLAPPMETGIKKRARRALNKFYLYGPLNRIGESTVEALPLITHHDIQREHLRWVPCDSGRSAQLSHRGVHVLDHVSDVKGPGYIEWHILSCVLDCRSKFPHGASCCIPYAAS